MKSGLRIVGGSRKGRALRVPGRGTAEGRALRPTADRARESLFNVLAHGVPDFELAGATVIDVFAGTGALGLEALSRGAGHAVFIDDAPPALACVRENAGNLGFSRAVTMLKLDARRLPPPPLAAKTPAALVFLDPPYGSGLAPAALAGLAQRGWLRPGAVAVAEVEADEKLEPPKGFAVFDERTYGRARLVFLRFG